MPCYAPLVKTVPGFALNPGALPDDGSRIQVDTFKSEVAFSELLVNTLQVDGFKSEVGFLESFVDTLQVDIFKLEVCFLEV